MKMTQISFDTLPLTASMDHRLVSEITKLINKVYSEAEKGMWTNPNRTRTTECEIGFLAAVEGIVVARIDGQLVGCVHISSIDETTWEFGMLAVKAEYQNQGIGGALIGYAEYLAGCAGMQMMQLKVLVPKLVQSSKESLKHWYMRKGYKLKSCASFEEYNPRDAVLLAVECDFPIFSKKLAFEYRRSVPKVHEVARFG